MDFKYKVMEPKQTLRVIRLGAVTIQPKELEFVSNTTEIRKGHFLSDIYQKRNWNKEIRTEIKTKNIYLLMDLLYRLNDITSR